MSKDRIVLMYKGATHSNGKLKHHFYECIGDALGESYTFSDDAKVAKQPAGCVYEFQGSVTDKGVSIAVSSMTFIKRWYKSEEQMAKVRSDDALAKAAKQEYLLAKGNGKTAKALSGIEEELEVVSQFYRNVSNSQKAIALAHIIRRITG